MDNNFKIKYLEEQLKLKEDYIKVLEESISKGGSVIARGSDSAGTSVDKLLAGIRLDDDVAEAIDITMKDYRTAIGTEIAGLEEAEYQRGDVYTAEDFLDETGAECETWNKIQAIRNLGEREEQIVRLIVSVAVAMKDDPRATVKLSNQQVLDYINVKSNETMIISRKILISVGLISYEKRVRRSAGEYKILFDTTDLD